MSRNAMSFAISDNWNKFIQAQAGHSKIGTNCLLWKEASHVRLSTDNFCSAIKNAWHIWQMLTEADAMHFPITICLFMQHMFSIGHTEPTPNNCLYFYGCQMSLSQRIQHICNVLSVISIALAFFSIEIHNARAIEEAWC